MFKKITIKLIAIIILFIINILLILSILHNPQIIKSTTNTSLIGYYADIDGDFDGINGIDGIIFVDFAYSVTNGKWEIEEGRNRFKFFIHC